jgi:hypothetical protein
MKKTWTKLVALLGMVSLLTLGCATTQPGPRPAPTPEEIKSIIQPTVNFVIYKIKSNNPDLVPYLVSVGKSLRVFAESDSIEPIELARLIRSAFGDLGMDDLDPDAAALVHLIGGTAVGLYEAFYGGNFVIEDRPAWLDTVLLVIADGLDPQI